MLVGVETPKIDIPFFITIVKLCKRTNLEVFCTEHKGHAREYLKNIDSNLFTNIIVYGGDGTFHEVINGLLSRDDQYTPALGLLPGGSGNSVMHHLNKLKLCKFLGIRFISCHLFINPFISFFQSLF